MKRRLGEFGGLKNNDGASGVISDRNPRIRRSNSSEYFRFKHSCEDSFRRWHKHQPRHTAKRNVFSGGSNISAAMKSKTKATSTSTKEKIYLAPRGRFSTSSISVLAISFMSMAGSAVAFSTTAIGTISLTKRNENRNHRDLQGSIQQCKIALAVGDIDRDDLLGQSEYLRFVNQLGSKIGDGQNSDYAALSFFDELPQGLKENYDYFVDSRLDKIDISGSKPGQAATSEQDEQLIKLCDFTTAKIIDPNAEVTVTNDPPAGPGSFGNDIIAGNDCNTSVDRGKCNVDLSISDSYQNNLLDESDYVKFVNRLSGNKFVNFQFEELPLNIKENFFRFATNNGQVDVSGSKPGQRVSVEQDRFLDAFCCETDLVVQNPDQTISEEPAPQPGGPTSAPTFDLFFCQRSMASSDLNRDDGLTEEEYVTFLNRLTNNQFVGQSYNALDTTLKTNFANLSGNDGKIDIYGSKPGQATNAEEDNALAYICVETGKALSGGAPPVVTPIPTAQSPVESPTPKPSMRLTNPPSPQVSAPPQESPNVVSGRSEAYNSFIISNRGGLTAADLKSGTINRDGLDRAYGIFVEEAVKEFSVANGFVEIGNLRRRKLAVEFLPDSDQIYSIVDSDCPKGLSSREKCQTAFAKFQLTINEEDIQKVSESYTTYTQNKIADGVLQDVLQDVDERTILKIYNVSYPVTPQLNEITDAPTGTPSQDDGNKKRKVAGPIVGGIFCVLLLGAIIGYVYFKGLPFELPAFLNRGGARVGNKADDDDDEVGLGFSQDDDDLSDGDKNSFGKDFDIDNRNNLGVDDDDDEEDKEQKDKNRFGFPTKNKTNDEEDIDFGLDSKRDLNPNSGNVSDNMYAFEEPSEIESETENQDDQRSAVENEDMDFGAKSETPNWGTNNVFDTGSSNQEWGANGGEENFFGTSAFGEGQEEQELSQSVSEESESFSSEDETYESGEIEETENPSEQDSATYEMEEIEQEDSYTVSSADESYNSSSLPSEKMSSDLKLKNEDMDAAIDNGDWDAVVEAAKAFDKGDQESSMAGSSKKTGMDGDDDDIEDDSYSESYTGSGDGSETTETTTTTDRRKRAEYRAQVEELVQIVLPDETEKVDAMMDQFKGREAELVSTLQTMEERSSNQRARAAIHKSKPPSQQQNTTYSMGGTNGSGMQGGEGSTAGTAAIAAASLPIPAEGMFDDEAPNDDFDGDFGDEDAFGEGEDQYEVVEGSEYTNEYYDQTYYSEEDPHGSGSFYSEEEGSQSRSYYTEEGSQSRSFYSQEEDSQERSFYSQEEGSQERSFYSQEGESIAESYYSEEGSQSYYSGSYESGEEGSDGQD